MSPDVVLVTEDDSTDVLLLRRAFERAGMATRLETVSNGEAAIAYLAGEGRYADRDLHPFPSLVLLDIKLPRMSGLDVLTWIRQQPGFGRLPVIMLTTSGRAADIRRAYEAGASAYHEKPAGLDELVEVVRGLSRGSFIWTDPVASAGKPSVDRADEQMFPAGAGELVSVKSKVHRVLSRHPDGLTAEAVADKLLRLGLARGERAAVVARVEALLSELETARSPRRVTRTPDGRYRVVGLW